MEKSERRRMVGLCGITGKKGRKSLAFIYYAEEAIEGVIGDRKV